LLPRSRLLLRALRLLPALLDLLHGLLVGWLARRLLGLLAVLLNHRMLFLLPDDGLASLCLFRTRLRLLRPALLGLPRFGLRLWLGRTRLLLGLRLRSALLRRRLLSTLLVRWLGMLFLRSGLFLLLLLAAFVLCVCGNH
jgi:hypothetical protein